MEKLLKIDDITSFAKIKNFKNKDINQKVIDVVKQYAQKFLGDPILFLSKSQKPKTDR